VRDALRAISQSWSHLGCPDEALLVEALIDGVLLGNWDTDAWARLRSMPRG